MSKIHNTHNLLFNNNTKKRYYSVVIYQMNVFQVEYRYWLQPEKSIGKADSQRSWFEVKGDIELRHFSFAIGVYQPGKKCGRCQRIGHSSKRCIHDSQYVAYYYDDVKENKNLATPVDIFDVFIGNQIILLKRLPWLLAVKLYGLENMCKYADHRESLLFSQEERVSSEARIESLLPCPLKRTCNSPPPGYVCHTCNNPGHWRQNCPLHNTLQIDSGMFNDSERFNVSEMVNVSERFNDSEMVNDLSFENHNKRQKLLPP